MNRVYILAGVIAALGWVAVGLYVAKGPQPEIIVPAEIITTLGPLNLSNTLIASWIVMAIIIVMSVMATRSMKLIPSGWQNFIEASIEFLVTQIEDIAGRERGRRFFMIIATIFLFVIISNWFGLMPFFNAIGRTEDVGHEIFHEISLQAEEGQPFAERDSFAGVKMEHSGSIVWAKPRTAAEEFEVEEGETASEALDRYVVFLATVFTDFELPEGDGEDHEVTAADVTAAAAALKANPDAPQLLTGGEAGEAHGVHSEALNAEITGVEFPKQKFALIIPLLRSPFSDVNNTLALALIAFVSIEFWGFQALGFRYLTKFFNLNGIGSFVGILELLSEFIRIISFAFRLFGNVFAGEVLVLILTFLMPFLFVDIIYGLELFVGFIQATVFALLTLVFAIMATEAHGEDHHEEGSGGHAEGHETTGAAQASH